MHIKFIFPLLFLFGCYSIPEIEGFNKDQWLTSECAEKLALAQVLMDHQDQLLGEGEAEIKALLGVADEHELYNRNQKFFYYDLNPSTCSTDSIPKRLSFRFDALDRVKEILIINK